MLVISLSFVFSLPAQAAEPLDSLVLTETESADLPGAPGLVDRPAVALEDGPDGLVLLYESVDYEAAMADRSSSYQARVEALHGGAELDALEALSDALTAADEVAAEAAASASAEADDRVVFPLSCTEGGVTSDTEPDGGGRCKLIYGTDSRTYVSSARAYPYSKHVTVVLARPWDSSGSTWGGSTCSGTFVDETHVLTAAHCVYDTNVDKFRFANTDPDTAPTPVDTGYGIDYGRGYVCRAKSIDSITEFEGQCEFISYRWLSTNYVDASSDSSAAAIRNDYALLVIETVNHSSGLGDGRWMAMSSIDSASTLETKTAVSHGYPGRRPDTSDILDWTSFYDGSDLWIVGGLLQFHTHGTVDSETTTSRIATKVEAGHGQSGSAIFYYTDDATSYSGQTHYIIGVLAALVADNNGSTSNDTVDGPTVGQFRDFVLSFLP